MKQRLGGLLTLALGIVLIVGGEVSNSQTAAVGGLVPTCQALIGNSTPCPTGTISITEKTKTKTTSDQVTPADAPASWQVLITSTNCTEPSGNVVSQTLTVPNGGTASSSSLFIYTDPDHATSCEYTVMETPVAGYTAAFSPPSPVTIPTSRSSSVRHVTLTNTRQAAPSSPASASDSASAPASASATAGTTSSAAGESGSASASAAAGATSSSASVTASPVLANTGPRQQVRTSLYVGIALCVLGLALLVGGLPRRRPRRHT